MDSTLMDLLVVPNNAMMAVVFLWVVLTLCSLMVVIFPELKFISSHGKRSGTSEAPGDNRDMVVLRHLANVSVPKSYFTLMYVIGMFTSGLIMYHQFISTGRFCTAQGLFFLHVCRRLWECLSITCFGASTMHVSGLMVGIVHYIFTPASIYLALFTGSGSVAAIESSSRSLSATRGALALLLLFLFEYANYAQNRSHAILFNMKQSNKGFSGAHYSVPRGFWFNYVACPHYLAEIIIYISLWLLLLVLYCPDTNVLSWLMRCNFSFCVVWVATNLSVVALQQWKWYCSEPGLKGDVPEHWKALVPGVW